VPLNLNPELAHGRELQNNLRSIERHLADDHYVRDLSPGVFAVEAAGAIILDPTTLRYPVIQFPKVIVRARASFRRSSEWRTGQLAITVEYTSNVGAVANFRLAITADAFNADVLPGASLLVTEIDIPGPGVANTPLVTGPLYTTSSFASDRRRFGIGVARNGAHANDTNVNDLLILGVVVEHIPARMEVS
jgi:hypothetical protein